MTPAPEHMPWALPRKRDRFGLRTPITHAPDLLHIIAERLRTIAGERETPANRAYVEAALASPYWGLRVLAVRVFGHWGGRANKAWLMHKAARATSIIRHPDSAQRWADLETLTARSALRPLLKPDDAQWFLDTWFADGGRHVYTMGTGLGIVPDTMVLARLQTELTATEPQNRMGAAILIAARRDLPQAREMLARLARDPDRNVHGLASAHLRSFPAPEASPSAKRR